jgi:hypothetical protein
MAKTQIFFSPEAWLNAPGLRLELILPGGKAIEKIRATLYWENYGGPGEAVAFEGYSDPPQYTQNVYPVCSAEMVAGVGPTTNEQPYRDEKHSSHINDVCVANGSDEYRSSMDALSMVPNGQYVNGLSHYYPCRVTIERYDNTRYRVAILMVAFMGVTTAPDIDGKAISLINPGEISGTVITGEDHGNNTLEIEGQNFHYENRFVVRIITDGNNSVDISAGNHAMRTNSYCFYDSNRKDHSDNDYYPIMPEIPKSVYGSTFSGLSPSLPSDISRSYNNMRPWRVVRDLDQGIHYETAMGEVVTAVPNGQPAERYTRLDDFPDLISVDGDEATLWEVEDYMQLPPKFDLVSEE